MKQMNTITHLAVIAIVSVLTGLVYATVQQAYRSEANDPQLQTARDISHDLEAHDPHAIDKWFNGDKRDISQSLGVFGVLYDEKHVASISSGLFHGKMPSLPSGVFDFARDNGENVFTWQPERGTRMAVVLKSVAAPPYSFVAVGRSLNEVEKREDNLRWMVVIAWLLCTAVIMMHWFIHFMRAPLAENR